MFSQADECVSMMIGDKNGSRFFTTSRIAVQPSLSVTCFEEVFPFIATRIDVKKIPATIMRALRTIRNFHGRNADDV